MPDPTLTPSVSLDVLKSKSSELAQGGATLRQQITDLRAHTDQLEKNLIATDGAKQIIDRLIAELSPVPQEPAK